MTTPGLNAQLSLGDIAEAIVDCEHKTAPTQDRGIPLIRTTNIKNGRLDLDSARRVSEETFQIWSRRIIPLPDDIIMAREAPVGEVGIVPRGERVCLGQRTTLVRMNKAKVDPNYVLYLLCTREMKHEMTSRAAGSVVQHLNVEDIRTLPIPKLPALPEQGIRGSVLRCIDEKIALVDRTNRTLEAMVRTIYRHWFADFEFPNEAGKPYLSSAGPMEFSKRLGGEIPEGWDVSTIGDELDTVLGGTPSTENKSFWEDGTVPWINSSKVNEFRIVVPTALITEDGVDNSATKLAPRGTTVLAITGATLGQVTRVEIDTYVNQSVVGIPGSESLPSEYLYFWVKSNIGKIIRHRTGAAQQHINKGNVDESTILIPPKQVVEAYQKVAKPIFERISSACFEIRSLSKMRDLLLPRLMSGKIKVRVEPR